MLKISRRSVLAHLVAVPTIGTKVWATASADGLNAIARRNGLVYGCAVKSDTLRSDPALKGAVIQNAGIVVPEYELKARKTWPARDRFDFSGGDYIVDFAHANGMAVRGHTLIWHQAVPDWLPGALATKPDIRFLTDYVQAVVGRYKGRIRAWDVVNEAVDPKRGAIDNLVANPWFAAYGFEAIETAFRAAREADPSAKLFYCDTNTEMDVDWNDKRRQAVLILLEKLTAKGVPIDGFAVQGHIKPFVSPFNQEVYAKFLGRVSDLGLRIVLSEFDVADKGGDPDPVKRDAQVASATQSFLDVVLANRSSNGVLTWGITDKGSWLSTDPNYRWADGQLARGLPLDAEMRKTPMWGAIAKSLANAPAR